MTSMRRRYVASTSLRRHVPATNLPPPPKKKKILNLGPPNILNFPTPMQQMQLKSTPKHKLELFDKLVAPILNYGSQVWGFCEAKQTERTHLMFCKQLLGVTNSTQNDFIYGELGRTSFYVHRIYAFTKYWFKILQSDDRQTYRNYI